MSSPLIAFIGAGNMGQSLIGGLIKDGHPAERLIAADPDKDKLLHLHHTYHIHTTQNNLEAVAKADVVLLAVKPQLLSNISTELKQQFSNREILIISIAAGVNTQTLGDWFGDNCAIVRAMPNMPALIGCGATAIFANAHTNQAQHDTAEKIMRAVGVVSWVKQEALLDTITALSGSGPAYFFLFMHAMEEAAIALGLDKETAHLFTLQTGIGAARMAMESKYTLKELKEQVTSKGGTTERALEVLESQKLPEIVEQALTAAKNRAEELAHQFIIKQN